MAFTHTVVDMSSSEAHATSQDKDNTQYKFSPKGGSSASGSVEISVFGRCWENDIGAFWVKICFDKGENDESLNLKSFSKD